ncbi:MAG: kelch repeat-containing protein [Anaerovorax sp.]|nr:kelch repeat-containing protein [Anaerovorax sp.]
MKRFIAIIMTLCMVLGMSGISTFGAEEDWKKEAPMPIEMNIVSTASVGNKIYVFGGMSKRDAERTLNIYDETTKKWGLGAEMPENSVYATASVVGNKIYVISGSDGRSDSVKLKIYDVESNTWSIGSKMPSRRVGAASAVVNNNIYVFGGQSSTNDAEIVQVYNTETDTWIKGTTMPKAREGLVACTVGNKIYVIGGRENVSTPTENTVEIYDTTTNVWTTGASMTTARSDMHAAVIGDKIYVIGGTDGKKNVVNIVEVYDTKTNKWESGPSMIIARKCGGIAVLNDKIYMMGGDDYKGNYFNSMESLQVATQTTTPKLSALLNIGEKVQLSTSYNLANNTNYTWSSTNEAVATVDANGKVTAVAIGEVDIYAQNTDGTFKEYIPVKVVEGIADELRLAVHLKVGEKAKLYLTDNPSEVIWSSMDESVATVSSDGQVIGIKKGLAIIQGELAGQTYQIYVRVNG